MTFSKPSAGLILNVFPHFQTEFPDRFMEYIWKLWNGYGIFLQLPRVLIAFNLYPAGIFPASLRDFIHGGNIFSRGWNPGLYSTVPPGLENRFTCSAPAIWKGATAHLFWGFATALCSCVPAGLHSWWEHIFPGLKPRAGFLTPRWGFWDSRCRIGKAIFKSRRDGGI